MNQTTPEHQIETHTLEEVVSNIPSMPSKALCRPAPSKPNPPEILVSCARLLTITASRSSLLVKIPIEDNGEALVDVFQVCPELSWAGTNPQSRDFPRCGSGTQNGR